MAEWSKALRSGRSIFGCVGSNPTSVKFLNILDYISGRALHCDVNFSLFHSEEVSL